ncbi:hypothetical protein GY45DRAFT_661481 [Cubamyces sp. BRFM 1775]|nr:hypothetical protein GY45DRAFT_661481 [Cubamyces sp. BRFM 1775]
MPPPILGHARHVFVAPRLPGVCGDSPVPGTPSLRPPLPLPMFILHGSKNAMATPRRLFSTPSSALSSRSRHAACGEQPSAPRCLRMRQYSPRLLPAFLASTSSTVRPQQTHREVQVYACYRARISFLKVSVLTHTIRHQVRVSRTGREPCSPSRCGHPSWHERAWRRVALVLRNEVALHLRSSGRRRRSRPGALRCVIRVRAVPGWKAVAQCGAAARRVLPLPRSLVLLRRAVYVNALGRAQRTRLRRRKMLCA